MQIYKNSHNKSNVLQNKATNSLKEKRRIDIMHMGINTQGATSQLT